MSSWFWIRQQILSTTKDVSVHKVISLNFPVSQWTGLNGDRVNWILFILFGCGDLDSTGKNRSAVSLLVMPSSSKGLTQSKDIATKFKQTKWSTKNRRSLQNQNIPPRKGTSFPKQKNAWRRKKICWTYTCPRLRRCPAAIRCQYLAHPVWPV